MATLQQTRGSGSKFENELTDVISRYTTKIWRNVRIETLLTASGFTEVDIIFCFKDLVFIIEAKNVSAIIGDYGSRNWVFAGSKAPLREVSEYSALNTITQNNIHVRSFKDMFYAYFDEWPNTVSAILVPNSCKVSPELEDAVYTIGQLDEFLAQMSSYPAEPRVHRRVAGLFTGDGCIVRRPDFKDTTSGRIKVSEGGVKGGY